MVLVRKNEYKYQWAVEYWRDMQLRNETAKQRKQHKKKILNNIKELLEGVKE